MKDLFSVSGKVVVVTGGTRGIGHMIAQGFVEGGAKVYVCSRKQQACDETTAELSKLGECIGIAADLATEPGVEAFAHEIGGRETRVHVLVNNAGTNWAAPLAEYPDSAWDKVLALNVKSIFHLTKHLAPLLEKAATPADPARVINIGSVDALHAPPLETYAYSTSKAAVHHMTRVLAKQLASRRITVNAIAPGPFPSKMMKETLESFGEAIIASVPLSRIGEPEDMAGVALYLASRAGAYVTGAVIPVDGGMVTCL